MSKESTQTLQHMWDCKSAAGSGQGPLLPGKSMLHPPVLIKKGSRNSQTQRTLRRLSILIFGFHFANYSSSRWVFKCAQLLPTKFLAFKINGKMKVDFTRLSLPETGMDSRNVWGDFHIYTFQIYKEVQEQMLGAGHGSACLPSHLASMARLILFLYNLQSGQNSQHRFARHNASTLLLTGPLHGEIQPTPPQSDTPTPAGSTRGGQVFPPEKHRPERHSVVVFPGSGRRGGGALWTNICLL